MLNQKVRRAKKITRNMGISRFVEVELNGAVEAAAGTLKIGDIRLERSSPIQCDFLVKDETNVFPYRVEVKLCSTRFPIARCDCDNGLLNISCEHLIAAVQMYDILSKLGIAESLISDRPFIWNPYYKQAN